jgi:hypothetical protein
MQKSNQELINELNEIRRNQKKVSDFNSVAEWVAYGQEIAKKKADIMNQLEILNSRP